MRLQMNSPTHCVAMNRRRQVEHDLRNAHERLPSLKLPRTVKRHTSMNRLLDMKFQQKCP